MIACRKCRGGHVRRSPLAWYHRAAFVVFLRPYYCLSCGASFLHLARQPLMIEISERAYDRQCRKRRQAERYELLARRLYELRAGLDELREDLDEWRQELTAAWRSRRGQRTFVEPAYVRGDEELPEWTGRTHHFEPAERCL